MREAGETDDGFSTDDSLRSLFVEHRAAINAYCRRRLPAAEVADAVSDVFLTAWRRVNEIPDGAELPWLYGVARNVVSNHLRSGRRFRRLWAALDAQPRLFEPDAEVQVVRRAEDRMVFDALATLSAADQELLRLRAWEELTSAEIGAVLAINPSAVDMRLTRARRRLERALVAAGYLDFVPSPRISRNGGQT